jgi:hypothetical protein
MEPWAAHLPGAAPRAARRRGLADLGERKEALERALGAYAGMDRGQAPVIGLRAGSVRLPSPRPARPDPDDESEEDPARRARSRLARDLATRPPVTRLLHRKSNALPLLLTAIYVAHLEGTPGQAYSNGHRNATRTAGAESWATLAGLHASGKSGPRNRRVRVTRALAQLDTAGLVETGRERQRDRFESFRLNHEDGSQRQYTVPGGDAPDMVHLPASFFVNGWHLALEPTEIAALLAIIDLGQRIRAEEFSVALPMSVRWETYGISGEVYEAVHELAEFGVIELNDPMPRRRRGKFRPFTEDQQDVALSHGNWPGPVPYASSTTAAWSSGNAPRTSSPPPSGETRTLLGWQPAASADHPNKCRQKSRASHRVACPHGTSTAQRNRNQRRRSNAYERCVEGLRPPPATRAGTASPRQPRHHQDQRAGTAPRSHPSRHRAEAVHHQRDQVTLPHVSRSHGRDDSHPVTPTRL